MRFHHKQDKAIKQGFANLKPASQYDNLYESAISRAKAGLVGGVKCDPRFNCEISR